MNMKFPSIGMLRPARKGCTPAFSTLLESEPEAYIMVACWDEIVRPRKKLIEPAGFGPRRIGGNFVIHSETDLTRSHRPRP